MPNLSCLNVTKMKTVFSALAFVLFSLLNKLVKSSIIVKYVFPTNEVLELCRMVATVLVLWMAQCVRLVRLPPLDTCLWHRVFPLQYLYMAVKATDFGSIHGMNFSVFIAIRRLITLMIMIFEKVILGIEASCAVKASVIAIVGGALISAADRQNDDEDGETCSWTGFIYLILNNVFMAAILVNYKKIIDSKDVGVYGLLFYDSLFTILPALVVAWNTVNPYGLAVAMLWIDYLFWLHLTISCLMGMLLSYSIMLCTRYNSALTTSIIECLKNILVTYIIMALEEENMVSWLNFVGMLIGLIGSLVYVCIAFTRISVPANLQLKESKNTLTTI